MGVRNAHNRYGGDEKVPTRAVLADRSRDALRSARRRGRIAEAIVPLTRTASLGQPRSGPTPARCSASARVRSGGRWSAFPKRGTSPATTSGGSPPSSDCWLIRACSRRRNRRVPHRSAPDGPRPRAPGHDHEGPPRSLTGPARKCVPRGVPGAEVGTRAPASSTVQQQVEDDRPTRPQTRRVRASAGRIFGRTRRLTSPANCAAAVNSSSCPGRRPPRASLAMI